MEKKKKIFLLAFTHSALDSLLKKLKNLKIKFIRITSTPNKVNKEIRPFILENLIEEKQLYDLNSYLSFVNSFDVWATTPFSIHHPSLFKSVFDYCIIDEASQMTLPVKKKKNYYFFFIFFYFFLFFFIFLLFFISIFRLRWVLYVLQINLFWLEIIIN